MLLLEAFCVALELRGEVYPQHGYTPIAANMSPALA